jgi:CMP/dCMP kinase
VIAIDGPAASGKGTLSRSLAAALHFAHLDTGSLYRATALRLLRGGAGPVGGAAAGARGRAAEALAIAPADLLEPELRTEAVGQAA